jgi:hypothetical protein
MQTVDLNSLLDALKPLMLQLLGEAKTCWLLLASIQIIYAGGMFMFGAAPKWAAFTYPIAALILLQNYDDLVRTILSIPDTLGFNFLDNALSSTEAQWQRFLEVFVIDDITLGGLVTEGLWSILLGVCTFFCWTFALVAYFLLLHAQYAAVGVLYVVGPFAVLAACTRATFSYFLRWVTTCVECGSWTLIMAILLSSAVKMAESITVVAKPNWEDPETWRSAFTTMGVMVLRGRTDGGEGGRERCDGRGSGVGHRRSGGRSPGRGQRRHELARNPRSVRRRQAGRRRGRQAGRKVSTRQRRGSRGRQRG